MGKGRKKDRKDTPLPVRLRGILALIGNTEHRPIGPHGIHTSGHFCAPGHILRRRGPLVQNDLFVNLGERIFWRRHPSFGTNRALGARPPRDSPGGVAVV